MEWVAGVVIAVLGALGGLLVPRVVAAVPEPEPDPEEEPGDYPDKVPYADLARRRHLGLWCAVAGAVAGAAMGLSLGWSWGLLWLTPLIPVCLALAVIDYVTWYLPTVIVAPSYIVVAVLVAVAALARQDAGVAIGAGIGYLALGLYYGVMWLISPRIMAFGDVRLGALLGLALGPFGALTVIASIFLAALSMLVAMLPMARRGATVKREKGVLGGVGKRHLPFGPFLVIGALLALVAGQVLGTS